MELQVPSPNSYIPNKEPNFTTTGSLVLDTEFTPRQPTYQTLQSKLHMETSPKNLNSSRHEDHTEKIKRIINIKQRSPDDAKILYDHLRDFAFFDTFNDRNTEIMFDQNAFIQICQSLHYEKHPAKSVIFKQRDHSNGKLYILYSGRVNIVEDNYDEHSARNPHKQNEALEGQDINGLIAKNISRGNDNDKMNLGEKQVPSSDRKNPVITISKANNGDVLDSEPVEDYKEKYPSIMETSNDYLALGKSINDFGAANSQLKIPTSAGRDKPRTSTLVSNLRKKGGEDDKRRSRQQLTDVSEDTKKNGWQTVKRIVPLMSISMKLRTLEDSRTERSRTKIAERKATGDLIREYGVIKSQAEKGGFFGEQALFNKHPREQTAIAETDCEVLVLYKRDFHFINRNYDKKRLNLINFIVKFIPEVESGQSAKLFEDLGHLFKEKVYEKGSYLMHEGAKGHCFFMLYGGNCEIIKSLKIDETPNLKEQTNPLEQLVRIRPVYSEELSICNVEKGAFLGEEIIFDSSHLYNFSVKVTSASAVVFSISKETFYYRFSHLTQNSVSEMYKLKMKKHANLIHYIIGKKFPAMEIQLAPFANRVGSSRFQIVTDQISLKAKERIEVKRKAKIGLFRSLVERSGDNSILNQYTAAQAETKSPNQNMELIRQSSRPEREKSLRGLQVVHENDQDPIESEAFERIKATLELQRMPSSPIESSKSKLTNPNIFMSRQRPMSSSVFKTSRAGSKPDEKTLKLDPTLVQQVEYISSEKAWELQTNLDGLTTPQKDSSMKKYAELHRDYSTKSLDPKKDVASMGASPRSKFDPKMNEEVDMPIEFDTDLFESSKKSKKLLEIKKRRILMGNSPLISSTVDNRNPGLDKVDQLMESIKDKLHSRIKSPANSNRVKSARRPIGPLLLISSPRFEQGSAPKSAQSKFRTRQGSLPEKVRTDSTPCGLGPYNALEIHPDVEIESHFLETPIITPIQMDKKGIRPFTATEKRQNIFTATSGRNFGEKAGNKPKSSSVNTKILKMKHHKMVKIQLGRDFSRFAQEAERIKKSTITLDFKVNGNIQAHNVKGTPQKTPRPMSSSVMLTKKSPRGKNFRVSGIEFNRDL